jgi:hypothetical protein
LSLFPRRFFGPKGFASGGPVASPLTRRSAPTSPREERGEVKRDAARPQTNWSIRVPWPGGSAARSVGCGVRELPASASGFTSGVFGSLASGIFTAGDAVTLEILIGNILGSFSRE